MRCFPFNYIEIVGLPGAGKSTFLHSFQNSKYAGVYHFSGPSKSNPFLYLSFLFCLVFTFLFKHTYSALRLLSRSDGRALIMKLSYRLSRLPLAYQRTFLVDCGIYQPLVSYLAEYNYGDTSVHDVYALSTILPRPSCLIFFSIDPNVALNRYQIRKVSTGRYNDFSRYWASGPFHSESDTDVVPSIDSFFSADLLLKKLCKLSPVTISQHLGTTENNESSHSDFHNKLQISFGSDQAKTK